MGATHPQNRQIDKTVKVVLQRSWLWQSQLSPAAELDGAGAVVSRFVYAKRPNVPDYLVKGGVTYRLVLDQLGSVRLVVNTSDGTVAQRIDYDEVRAAHAEHESGVPTLRVRGRAL